MAKAKKEKKVNELPIFTRDEMPYTLEEMQDYQLLNEIVQRARESDKNQFKDLTTLVSADRRDSAKRLVKQGLVKRTSYRGYVVPTAKGRRVVDKLMARYSEIIDGID